MTQSKNKNVRVTFFVCLSRQIHDHDIDKALLQNEMFL